ncbi:MAG: hypothetical protein AAFO01_05655 [Pseudomonadota bacterium]
MSFLSRALGPPMVLISVVWRAPMLIVTHWPKRRALVARHGAPM